MRSSASKGQKPTSKSKQGAAEGLLSNFVSKFQVPKLKPQQKQAPDDTVNSGLDQLKSDICNQKAEKVSNAVTSPDVSSPQVTEQVARVAHPTPEPLVVLPAVLPAAANKRVRQSTARPPADLPVPKQSVTVQEPPAKSAKQEKAGSTGSDLNAPAVTSPCEAAKAAEEGLKAEPVLKNGDDVFRFMQDLAKEAEQVLPQEDGERPKRRRKEKGGLLVELKESWGTEVKKVETGSRLEASTAHVTKLESPLFGVVTDAGNPSSLVDKSGSPGVFSFSINVGGDRDKTPSLDANAKSRPSKPRAENIAKQPSCEALDGLETVADEAGMKLQAAAMAAAMSLVRRADAQPTTRPSAHTDSQERRLSKKPVIADSKAVKAVAKPTRAAAGFGSSSSRGLASSLDATKKAGRPASREPSAEVTKSAPASGPLTKSAKENVVPQPGVESAKKSRGTPGRQLQPIAKRDMHVQRAKSAVEQLLHEAQVQANNQCKLLLRLEKELIAEKEVRKQKDGMAKPKDESAKNKVAAQKAAQAAELRHDKKMQAQKQQIHETKDVFLKLVATMSRFEQFCEAK